jgi:vancomycin permeability regulator SanA
MARRPPPVLDRGSASDDSGEHVVVPRLTTGAGGGGGGHGRGDRRAPAKRSWFRRWSRRLAIAGSAAATVIVVGVVGANLHVTRSIDAYAFDAVDQVPERPVAIIFGAGVVNGQATPALADRVQGGIDLYRAGRVGHLLMTGDNSSVDYDEVSVMRDLAIDAGVPADAITRDHAGFDTRSSCYRARDVFGVEAAVLVTQDYHLSRALYSCRDLGLDAVGLRIPDWQHHPERLGWGQYPGSDGRRYMAREWLARVNALVEAHATHPEPQFLGPYLGLGDR